MMTAIGDCFGFFGSIPICCCTNPYRTVTQGSIGLIAKFGKCYKLVDPGLHQINLMTETLRTVDVKIQVEDIKKQVVLTKDNVAIYIDSVVYWQIIEPYTATYLVSNVRTALIERTQTTLRQIIGGRLLQDVIENRETISHEISEIIAEPARTWGIRIEAILIKDIQFSQDLLDNLAAAAKQKRVGESKVIAAEAEVSAAKLMREASDILNTPAAMQIRYLDVLATMVTLVSPHLFSFSFICTLNTISNSSSCMTIGENARL
ncbi:hypothetical protein BKA69DRAFT_1068452, partial [Paraphysoderma sedebokerense]